MATVLVLGGGGREHALAWKLAQSADVRHVYVSPGNAGTESCPKTNNVDVNVKNFTAVVEFCQKESVSLVVVGPEDPLAAGIADHLNSHGIPCFGPSAKAAQIEASKDFSKQFMSRHGIPTARFCSFRDAKEACQHINQADYPALVVKASGLAAGKGVVVTKTKPEACQAVCDMLNNKVFGSAGETVVVEELLTGDEVSCLAFCDGSTISMMPPAQDHKQLNDGDTGPNTGGMGAICPYPLISDKDLEIIRKEILQRAVDGMKKEGYPFIGVLYAGVMLTFAGPKVLEFNCRFGDPETQSILPLLESDLYEICQACVEGKLTHNLPQFTSDLYTAGVVLASGGYPGMYKKGLPISGIDGVEKLGPRVLVFHAGTAKQEQGIVTSGGRVLAVVAVNSDLQSACTEAEKWAGFIKFDGVYHRSDIGFRVLDRHQKTMLPQLSYQDSGVNIEAGNSLVKAIQPLAKDTMRPGCDASLGGFGALFDIKAAGFTDPILVSGTDGVGTKLKIAQEVGDHSTIGQDLVAMCVNDILVQGAEPLFFLDYFATGHLNVDTAREIITGIATGCRQARCALVGGETAEMPGMYQGGEYDLAGFAVGAVERGQILPRMQQMLEGDVLIGLASSGLHSNGFSLVRKVVEMFGLRYDAPSPLSKGKTLGEELLVPTKIYVTELLPLMNQGHVKAFCHITGGGLLENLPRVLPGHLKAQIDASLWVMPAVFGWLAHKGNITASEMARTFNCGVGGVLVIDRSQTEFVLQHLLTSGLKASVIGKLQDKQGGESVEIKNLQKALTESWKVPCVSKKKKVGVLISGSGTNLQALIDSTRGENNSSSEIVLVISNKAGVQGLERAQKAGITTKVINHKEFGSRVEFDLEVDRVLREASVDIVCLAGFMRILSGEFVKKWRGHLLNVHPSLLPSFKGHNAHEQVLASGVRISGCTVHFVEEEVDAGAIVVQESVPVYPRDTVTSLAERVKRVEHKAFPRALELVASGQAVLKDGVIQWG
ncbi:trifunctional purine biosynthetic protein adenosine-3-like isoform X1 [Saccostrea cucullata]|uniref:trifunctional purine biosynthetic protein adenosine-3-like isoform X1 n=2 Tax=Saccostrea cuccullata TaxID=36930 RepID=UPI002ED0B736